MKGHMTGRSISALAALMVFCVFAAGIVAALLGGAGVYQRLTARDAAAYDRRTCAQVVAAKVRQAPGPESVSLVRFGADDALVITQEIEGRAYCTRLYCHDGWLMELFAPADEVFAPEDGEKLLQADALKLDLEGGLLRATVTDSGGREIEQWLFLRGGEGALP